MEQKKSLFRFRDMVKSLQRAIGKFPDKRTGKNTTYGMMDAAAGAFSVFFTQEPSFLSFQKHLEERYGLSNAKTLFEMSDIPTDNHIRDLLDPVYPSALDPVFADCLDAVRESGDLASFHTTILGDDLYCHQPMGETIRASGLNFILVCKPDSHQTLYEWLNGITEKYVIHKRNGNTRETWNYRYCPNVPLRDGDNAMTVNWCEVTIIRDTDGKQLYKNAFVTNHAITTETIEPIVAAGRARWKIENENNNTLKTKGYHLEHNYGHGRKYLSSLLATMNILAFLFHTILEITDQLYQ